MAQKQELGCRRYGLRHPTLAGGTRLFSGAHWRWLHDCAGLVDNNSTNRRQGSSGRQVVVAAQQQVN